MIILEGMTISFDDLIKLAIIITAIWGFVKIIMEIVKAITERHDKEQRWDESAKQMKEEHEKITKRYDEEITKLRQKIDENHCDTVAQTQEIKAELFVLTNAMLGVLDGLIEQGCDGVVKNARSKLSEYINERAHD